MRPSCVTQMGFFVYTGTDKLLANMPIFMQQSNIFKWFISALFSLTGPEAGFLLVASSPSGCCTENPLQAQRRILEMNDSSQMWSMKWSLLVFVYIKPPSCLMSQNPNKLAASSNKLSSLHPLHWCEESCPVRLRRQHVKQEEVSWQ